MPRGGTTAEKTVESAGCRIPVKGYIDYALQVQLVRYAGSAIQLSNYRGDRYLKHVPCVSRLPLSSRNPGRLGSRNLGRLLTGDMAPRHLLRHSALNLPIFTNNNLRPRREDSITRAHPADCPEIAYLSTPHKGKIPQ